MKTIDVIRTTMQLSHQATLGLAEDMRDAPFTSPTPGGGNHPMWVIGHLAFVEGNLPRAILGEPNPVAHWAPLFAPGAEPTTDASAYPPYEEVLRTYKDLFARNLEMLERLGDEGLSRPTVRQPRGLEQLLRTAGDAFLVTGIHAMHHRGQLADARRAAGRKPVFTPGFD